MIKADIDEAAVEWKQRLSKIFFQIFIFPFFKLIVYFKYIKFFFEPVRLLNRFGFKRFLIFFAAFFSISRQILIFSYKLNFFRWIHLPHSKEFHSFASHCPTIGWLYWPTHLAMMMARDRPFWINVAQCWKVWIYE